MTIWIDICACKISGTHTLLEQHVQLTIRSALWLRKPEVHPNNDAAASASPEVGRLRAPSLIGIAELIVRQDIDDNIRNVI